MSGEDRMLDAKQFEQMINKERNTAGFTSFVKRFILLGLIRCEYSAL